MATGYDAEEKSGNCEISIFSEQYWKRVVTQHYTFIWKLEFSRLSVHFFPDRGLKFSCWFFLWEEKLEKTFLEQLREPAKKLKKEKLWRQTHESNLGHRGLTTALDLRHTYLVLTI